MAYKRCTLSSSKLRLSTKLGSLPDRLIFWAGPKILLMQIRQPSQPVKSCSGQSGTPFQPDQSCSVKSGTPSHPYQSCLGKSGKPLSLINPAQANQAIRHVKEMWEKSILEKYSPTWIGNKLLHKIAVLLFARIFCHLRWSQNTRQMAFYLNIKSYLTDILLNLDVNSSS